MKQKGFLVLQTKNSKTQTNKGVFQHHSFTFHKETNKHILSNNF